MNARSAPYLLFGLLCLFGLSNCSDEKTPVPAKVSVTDSWTKEADEGARGVAYVTLVNEGTEPDRLLSVAAQGIQMAEVHNHIKDEGVMRMISVPSLEVPGSGTLTFQPGGLHIMLMGLERPIVAGETLHMTLKFEKTGIVTTDARVLTMDEVLERAN
ncbi:MAG: copper chaperone PCu(A)C [Alphaproteobacteria bacterium]|nr:MAG: copper chaperone PCu(A)C [Alphaproteobacteria bacterium]